MRPLSHTTLAVILTTLCAVADAGAAELTCSQVTGELESAPGNCELAHQITGARLNERYPQLYPRQLQDPAKTRAQVQAELAEADRTSEMEIGERGLNLYERFPERYAAARAEQAARSGTRPAGL